MSKSLLGGIFGVLVCALLVWQAGRIGYARTYAIRALKTNDVAAADRSVQLLGNDAETHAARGVVLQRTENYSEACRELESAAALRPRDYFLWMMLGVTRDLNDDPAGAIAALRQSADLAPLYARPRWLLGNLLLRNGQIDEAFQELRFAAERDRGFVPNVIDLAWGMSGNDPVRTIALVKPDNNHSHLKLAVFFAWRQQPQAAIEQFRQASSVSTADTNKITELLIASRSFSNAFETWSKLHCPACRPGSLINGSFEEEIDLSNRGFGWQMGMDLQALTCSIDNAEHTHGGQSLRVDFRGNPNAQTTLISQVLLVDPDRQYRLTFDARVNSFVSTAGPAIKVVDASDERLPLLAQSLVKADASGWQSYVVNFKPGGTTRAVRVIVTRDSCASGSCPAFGTLWLDSFALNADSTATTH